MKRGQLAAVILIVILVAVVAGILLFAGKRAGKAIATPAASIDCSKGTHTATIPAWGYAPNWSCSNAISAAITKCGSPRIRCSYFAQSVKLANGKCTFTYACG